MEEVFDVFNLLLVLTSLELSLVFKNGFYRKVRFLLDYLAVIKFNESDAPFMSEKRMVQITSNYSSYYYLKEQTALPITLIHLLVENYRNLVLWETSFQVLFFGILRNLI